jgi:ADP-heptose:LPS heptosyltransferase
VDCHYPLIHVSNERPHHFLQGFIEFLNERLGLQIKLSLFQGDIHLSEAEKTTRSQVEQITGLDLPHWIIVAGGKFDYTIKWWHFRRWQAVVDHFLGRMLFVQVGQDGDYHPPLKNVLDLRGKTSLRDLVQLVYYAQGVLCPVTQLMHLAAAVESKPGGPPNRPCVVVAGGREPPHWEAYPSHQFIHTVGALPCCAKGGCWRARSVPLGDGDSKDEGKYLCVDAVNGLPRCMTLITPQQVCERIEFYFTGGQVDYLEEGRWNQLTPFLRCDPFRVRPFDQARNGSSRSCLQNDVSPTFRRRAEQTTNSPMKGAEV